MDRWASFIAAVLDRHGVADRALAERHGITAKRFYRRAAREGWEAPAPRVRVHPTATPSIQRQVLVACGSTSYLVAASHETAAWLHGLRSHAPQRPNVVTSHDLKLWRDPRLHASRVRWLEVTDIVERDRVPTLDLPATLLTSLGLPSGRLWARLIDAVHRELTTPEEVLDRLQRVGPVSGKGVLRCQCEQLEGLRVESVFQDSVAEELARLGYRPGRSTLWIPTPDGIGLTVDIPLVAWKVAVEPSGDSFHRTREQRRIDRRRDGAFAGTDWVRVPVDWRDWLLDREHVLAAIDAAIAAQQRRGIGSGVVPPDRSAFRHVSALTQ